MIPRATISAIKERLEAWLGACPQDAIVSLIAHLKDKLDRYCQQKADFLAEITTEPLMTTKPAYFYREVIVPLIENRLFMDNIAANEDIRFDRLKIHVKINGKELRAIFRCKPSTGSCTTEFFYPADCPHQLLPYAARCPQHLHDALEVSVENGDSDLEVELPGPLGEFAFYSFLENFIRNSAKHNKNALSKCPLKITIAIEDHNDPNFYIIKIWDDITNPRKSVKNENGKEVTLIEMIRSYIQSDIIEPTGELKRANWGIAEMKICATLLRGSSDFTRTSEFLSVEEENGKMVYKFHLMKPKKLCALLPNLSFNDDQKLELQRKGIWIFNNLGDLEKMLSSSETIASFRFALFDCSNLTTGKTILEQLPKLLHKLPSRVIVLTGNDSLELPHGVRAVKGTLDSHDLHSKLQACQVDEVMKWLWEQWLKRWLDDGGNVLIDIYLEQSQHEHPTSIWVHQSQHHNSQCNLVKLRIWAKKGNGTGQANPVEGSPNANNFTHHLIYDRHRGILQQVDGDLKNRCYWSYIFLEKISPDFVTLFYPKFPQGNALWLLPYELAEAGLLRILIIDERAAESAFEQTDETDGTAEILRMLLRHTVNGSLPSRYTPYTPLKWHIAWACRVYICTHFGVDKEVEPLHAKVGGCDTTYLKIKISEDQIDAKINVAGEGEVAMPEVDMVVIHQGVLDHWCKSPEKQDELLQTLKKYYPFVIVESGRGIPVNLPENEKFLPFSLIHHYALGKIVGKYGLSRIALTICRQRRVGG